MNLNIQIPDNTALIFEYMQKGQFICSNSTDIDLRDMYNMIDENYESLYQYFSQINYTLERGNGRNRQTLWGECTEANPKTCC